MKLLKTLKAFFVIGVLSLAPTLSFSAQVTIPADTQYAQEDARSVVSADSIGLTFMPATGSWSRDKSLGEFSNNDKTIRISGGGELGRSNIGVPVSGKYYAEFYWDAGSRMFFGLINSADTNTAVQPPADQMRMLLPSGTVNSGGGAAGFSYGVGDTIGLAVDFDTSTYFFVKNNVAGNVLSFDFSAWAGAELNLRRTSRTGDGTFTIATEDSSFAYTVPAGYTGRWTPTGTYAYSTIPTYVSTTDNNHISVVTDDTIDAASITTTQPAGTDIVGLVSFDGRMTWEIWNGSEWVNQGAIDLSAYDFSMANTIAELESGLTGTLFYSNASIDFAFDLSTTDGQITPELGTITLDISNPAGDCYDGIMNGDETEADCGGRCGVCKVNLGEPRTGHLQMKIESF